MEPRIGSFVVFVLWSFFACPVLGIAGAVAVDPQNGPTLIAVILSVGAVLAYGGGKLLRRSQGEVIFGAVSAAVIGGSIVLFALLWLGTTGYGG